MKPERLLFSDHADARVAAYESLLDLFTLISFVLIFAAVIYVTRNVARYEASSLIDSKVAQHESGTAQILPRDGVLITIFKEGTNDKLSIKNLETGQVICKDVSQRDVASALADSLAMLIQVDKTNVAISGKKESMNAELLFTVQLWLAEHNLKYHLYFHPTDDLPPR